MRALLDQLNILTQLQPQQYNIIIFPDYAKCDISKNWYNVTMSKTLQYPITIKILYEHDAADAPYVAYIPEFDISSCGKTEEMATKNVKEALDLMLNEIKQDGNLDTFLEELGYNPKKSSIFPFPKIISEPFMIRLT